MRNFVTCSLLFFFSIVRGQNSHYNSLSSSNKPPIDLEVLGHWPHVSSPKISSDGKYISYTIEDQPVGSHTLFIQSSDGSWKKEWIGAGEAFFSSNGESVVFRRDDTLLLLKTGTDVIKTIPDITSLQSPAKAEGTWLGYHLKETPSTLVIHNLVSGYKKNFSDVTDYAFHKKGRYLVFKNNTSNSLKFVSLENGRIQEIWNSNDGDVIKYVFDENGEQFAFIVKSDTTSLHKQRNSIWYFRRDMDHAVKLVDEATKGVDRNLNIGSGLIEFSKTGRFIFFTLNFPVDTQVKKSDAVMLDVWHYKDVVINSDQLSAVSSGEMKTSFTAAVDIEKRAVIQVDKKDEYFMTPLNQSYADFSVVVNNQDKFWWKREEGKMFYIVSLKDGTRREIRKSGARNFIFSRDGNYLLYYDGKEKCFFSYDLKSNLNQNITGAIPNPLYNEYHDFSVPGRTWPDAVGVAAWIKGKSDVLLYDNYDIWRVDLTGKRPPFNITNDFGVKHNIKFRIVHEEAANEGIIDNHTPLLLTAFNTNTKHNGFYRCFIDKKSNPEELTMGPHLLYRVHSQIPSGEGFDDGMEPLKALNINKWIVKKQTSIEAPNFFVTSDFRKFQQLTDIQPHKKYNWLTTELVTWKQLDGTISQGILYKPENFDPQKKYPIIFHYYETFSYRMYDYPTPYLNMGRIDIPWYVSRGYLVFTPDIHYSIANISGKLAGDAAVNSIISAANYLIQRPYVDSTKLGLDGHSYAGGETLYIITNSSLFAAACAAAPTVSDQISAYLGILMPAGKPGGESRLSHSEIGHDRIGATLWERPDLFIKASPVFKANKVTTPLLIMHNQGDGACDWHQAIEMYIALRRLEKKVWMLQYDGQNHTVKGKAAVDYTIRLTQFFDYYLKEAHPPVWMTKGIPASLKGIESGLGLDYSGNIP